DRAPTRESDDPPPADGHESQAAGRGLHDRAAPKRPEPPGRRAGRACVHDAPDRAARRDRVDLRARPAEAPPVEGEQRAVAGDAADVGPLVLVDPERRARDRDWLRLGERREPELELTGVPARVLDVRDPRAGEGDAEESRAGARRARAGARADRDEGARRGCPDGDAVAGTVPGL